MPFLSEILDFELPFVKPLVTGRGVLQQRRGLLFALSDGTYTGWGEASPLEGWSGETLEQSRQALTSVSRSIRQLSASKGRSVEQVANEMRATPCARAAVIGALYDLLSQRREISLSLFLREKLGGGLQPSQVSLPPSSVRVNALIAHSDPDEVARSARDMVAAGFEAIKLKVGALDADVDLVRVAAVRQASDQLELRLDANGAWEIDQAIAFLEQAAQYDVAFCEEPTAGIDALVAVGAATAVPVAIDESAVSSQDVTRVLRTGKVGVVIIKPQILGGADSAASLMAKIKSYGARGIVTSMFESVVGVAHVAHIAAVTAPEEIHGLHTSSFFANDVGSGLEVSDARLHLASASGLGVAPNYAFNPA